MWGAGEAVQEETNKLLLNPLGMGVGRGLGEKDPRSFLKGEPQELEALAKTPTSLPLSDLRTRVLVFQRLGHTRGSQASAIRLLFPFVLTGGGFQLRQG